MALLNQVTRNQGNKAYPAIANINVAYNAPINNGVVGDSAVITGGNQQSVLGVGSLISVDVRIQDGDGADLGTQQSAYTVAGTDPDFDTEVGGIEIYHAMRNFCRNIEETFDPTVSCWASKVSGETVTFNIQPKGSDGAAFPARVSYELAVITAFVFTPVAP